ncbi:MAG: hypothetical protein QW273_01700 [Candidatus Pacearchaeota archaeon]
MYLEILYPTMMRFGHEFHGPYTSKNFFIKEFYNLKSPHFEFSNLFPFDNIILIEELEGYPEVDFFNHLLKPSKKRAVAILINKRLISEEEYDHVLKKILNSLKRISKKSSVYLKKEWLKTLARRIFFSVEDLRKRAMIDKEIFLSEVYKKSDNEKFVFQVKQVAEKNKERTKRELEVIIKNSLLKIFQDEN